jgi:hypothetical protein
MLLHGFDRPTASAPDSLCVHTCCHFAIAALWFRDFVVGNGSVFSYRCRCWGGWVVGGREVGWVGGGAGGWEGGVGRDLSILGVSELLA